MARKLNCIFNQICDINNINNADNTARNVKHEVVIIFVNMTVIGI